MSKICRLKESYDNHGYISEHIRPRNGGIYAIYPWYNFDTINRKHYGVYKIGLAVNYQRRSGQYHTSFVNGFFWVSLITINPTFKRPLESQVEKWKEYVSIYSAVLRAVENSCFREFFLQRFIRTRSHVDIEPVIIKQNMRTRNDGHTEWIYTSYEDIQTVFQTVAHNYSQNPDYNKLWTFNASEKTHIDLKPHVNALDNKNVFKATILYDLSNQTNLKQNMIPAASEYDAI